MSLGILRLFEKHQANYAKRIIDIAFVDGRHLVFCFQLFISGTECN